MANFEAFRQVISSSINLLFLKSELTNKLGNNYLCHLPILIVFFNALSCLQIDKIIVSALQQEVFSFLLGIIFNKTMYIGIRVSIRVVGDCCAFILLRRLQVSPLTVVIRFSVLVVLTHYYSTTIHNGLNSETCTCHKF